ncbi:MAG: hypothetical protein ACKVOJ_08775 [Sphingomonadaceae bacterium]
MRLAAVNAAVGGFALWYAHHLGGEGGELVRIGAQIQFMHGMASAACATFMNIGAVRARFSPAFFLGGSLIFALSNYAAALGYVVGAAPMALGGAIMAIGWINLVASTSGIDRD